MRELKKFLAIGGIIIASIGGLFLLWGAYVSSVDAGFQRDVPSFLTGTSVEIYGVLLVITGLAVTYSSSRRD